MALGLGFAAPASVDLGMGGHEAAIVEGVHGPERMYSRVARWTSGLAHIEWAGQFGVYPEAVEIELAPFFGRGGDQIELTVGRRTQRHRLLDDWHIVLVPVTTSAEVLVVDIRSDVHRASSDPRPFGVRLDRVSVVNGARTAFLFHLAWLPMAILLTMGALSWQAGRWLAADRSEMLRATAGAVFTSALFLGLHVGRAWLLSPSGLLMLAGSGAFAVVLVVILRRSGACSRPVALAVATACAAAWLTNAIVNSWYFVDVLRLDSWELVALIERSMTGTLRLTELWAPHNEHRPLTARLMALACAHLSQWNHWWEFAFLQVVAAIQVGVIAAHVAAPRLSWRVQPSVLVASAAMICATSQWENWLRGFQVSVLFGALGPSVALLVLCQRSMNWTSFAWAVAAAMVGQLSFGAGLLVWPIGALVIFARRQGPLSFHLAAWLVVSAVAIALYLPGLQLHPDAMANAHLAGTVSGWSKIAAGVLVMLAMPVCYVPAVFGSGSPVLQGAILAFAALAVTVWAVLVVLRWRQDVVREQAWLFPAALATFGLACCLLMAAGRASGGLLAMTASRYLVFPACFWIGVLLLAGLHTDARRVSARVAVRAFAIAMVTAALLASIGALQYMTAEWDRVRLARTQLIRGAVGEAAVVLYPDPFKLERMRGVLQRYRLSVFRPHAR